MMTRTIHILMFLLLALVSAATERSGHARSPRGEGDLSQNKAAGIVKRQGSGSASPPVVIIPPTTTGSPSAGAFPTDSTGTASSSGGSATGTGSSGSGSGTATGTGTSVTPGTSIPTSSGVVNSEPSTPANTGSQVPTNGPTATNNPPSSYSPSSSSSSSVHINTNAPLVVQQAAPDVSNEICQTAYNPVDAWSTSTDDTSSSSLSNTTFTTGVGGVNPPTVHNTVKGSCNNGTKVGNRVGSTIRLNFTGIEAALLIVPSKDGATYSIKLDDEEEKLLDSYKPDFTACEVSQPWSVSGLPNQFHTILVTIKGGSAEVQGSAAGTQLEYSGLIFKGPTTTSTTSGKGTSKWIIVGACIGAGILVIALGIILFICIRRRRASRVPPSQMVQNEQSAAFGHNRLTSTATSMSPPAGNPYSQHPTPMGSPAPQFLPPPQVGPMDTSFMPSSPPRSPPHSPRSMSSTWRDSNTHVVGPRPMSLTTSEYGVALPSSLITQGRPGSTATGYTYQSTMAQTGAPNPYIGGGQASPPPGHGHAAENPFVSGHSRQTSYAQNPFE